MAEFGEPLPIGKPKLEFIVNEQGMVSMRVSGNVQGLNQIAVGLNGAPLAVVPFTGLEVFQCHHIQSRPCWRGF
jgi:hypothetical protein